MQNQKQLPNLKKIWRFLREKRIEIIKDKITPVKRKKSSFKNYRKLKLSDFEISIFLVFLIILNIFLLKISRSVLIDIYQKN